MTGEHPYPNVNTVEKLFKHINEPIPMITSLDIDISRDVNEVIQKATAKNPQKRYEHVMALANAFKDAAGLSPSRAAKSLVALLTPREQEVLKGNRPRQGTEPDCRWRSASKSFYFYQ